MAASRTMSLGLGHLREHGPSVLPLDIATVLMLIVGEGHQESMGVVESACP